MTWSTFFPEKFPPHPPATEADVRALEERLDVELPPSYRGFLLFADGYGDPGDEYCLRPAATVGGQDCIHIRQEAVRPERLTRLCEVLDGRPGDLLSHRRAE